MFENFLNKHQAALEFYRYIAEHDVLDLVTHSDGPGMDVGISVPAGCPLIYHQLFNRLTERPGECLETYTFAQIMRQGPKVIRFDQFDFELLEHIDLNLQMNDFVMPSGFDAVIIELPKSYIRGKKVKCPQAGQEHIAYMDGSGVDVSIYPDEHYPIFVTVAQTIDKFGSRIIIPQVTLSSYQTFKTCLYWTAEERKKDSTVQDILDKCSRDKLYRDSMECSEQELDEFFGVIQSALNAVLLMDEIGLKKLPSPKRNRLREWQCKSERRLALLKKHGNESRLINREQEKLENIKRKLFAMPMIYELATRPTLFRIEGDQFASKPKISGIVTPHYRRGFYKMQHYGPGNSLRKRIRINAVFVNAKFLYN